MGHRAWGMEMRRRVAVNLCLYPSILFLLRVPVSFSHTEYPFFIKFFCEMLKNIASVQKSETESPNLNYVNKAST
ncbi:hypothetical protein H6H03_00800 [Nostoc paludosum FACHB-159]|uniref:Uncharacterized protein n=1 Tax=Nostoc paludosum FACHB-159 TaxID=2692908 RepID=A0ABR8JYG2_9NOSO|nr:hypothetical protein [Nostoc paludosum FACHB-159]